jgi:pterin-4a-carbinolamine dehydratase
MHAVIGLDPSEDWRERANARIQLRTLRYDPIAEFADQHPGWQFLIDPLGHGEYQEEIDFDEKIVRVTPEFYTDGPQWCAAHVAAHIELHGHSVSEVLTEDDCAMANTLAQIRLYP